MGACASVAKAMKGKGGEKAPEPEPAPEVKADEITTKEIEKVEEPEIKEENKAEIKEENKAEPEEVKTTSPVVAAVEGAISAEGTSEVKEGK